MFALGIGLCGEPCPSLCRTCNKLIVQETFFGKEDRPQARFVLLPDCGHICKKHIRRSAHLSISFSLS